MDRTAWPSIPEVGRSSCSPILLCFDQREYDRCAWLLDQEPEGATDELLYWFSRLSREKRFKRELQLARQVTHKNVVRIHDLGEIDGIIPSIEGSAITSCQSPVAFSTLKPAAAARALS